MDGNRTWPLENTVMPTAMKRQKQECHDNTAGSDDPHCNPIRAIKATPCNESGASEILGSLILIALFVAVLALLVTVMVSQPVPGTIPAITIVVTNQSTTVSLYHAGGDSVPVKDLAVMINGINTTFTGAGTDGIWSAGETLTASSSKLPQTVAILYDSGKGAVLLSSTDLRFS